MVNDFTLYERCQEMSALAIYRMMLKTRGLKA